jgi:hypothetical protein
LFVPSNMNDNRSADIYTTEFEVPTYASLRN